MDKLTTKDKILGKTEPTPLTQEGKNSFLATTKYKVGNKEGTNTSITTGEMVNNFLPPDLKRRIMQGALVVEYNGIVVERIVERIQEETTKEEVVVKEVKKPKKRVK
jgi:hypothetical protein